MLLRVADMDGLHEETLVAFSYHCDSFYHGVV